MSFISSLNIKLYPFAPKRTVWDRKDPRNELCGDPDSVDIQLEDIHQQASSSERRDTEYDVDAVLSAGELVIDEEERALLDSLGLETDSPKQARKTAAQKIHRRRSLRRSERIGGRSTTLQGIL